MHCEKIELYGSAFIFLFVFFRAGHPYLTGLSIAGGLYYFGTEGAFIGPMMLCCMLVGVNLYRFLLSETTELQAQGPPGTAVTLPPIKKPAFPPGTLDEFMSRTKAKRQRQRLAAMYGTPSTLPRRVQMLRSKSEDPDPGN